MESTIVRSIQVAAAVVRRASPALATRWLEQLFLTPRSVKQPSRERRWVSDARRTELTLSSGCRIPLLTWGDPGPTVLLVHGWAGRGSQLAAFAASLGDAGWRVVAYDAPAHGGAVGQRQTTLPELADTIGEVAAHVGGVSCVVAHSLGTSATARAIGDGLQLERVVFVAPPAEPGRYLQHMARYLWFGDEVARRAQTRIQIRVGRTFDELHTERLAADMSVPLLVVHDASDPVVDYRQGRAVAGAWPGAVLHTTEGLGHYRILRDPAVIREVSGFVGRPANRHPAGGVTIV